MLLFCDSFDHYGSIADKWNGGGSMSLSGGVGRFGTAAATASMGSFNGQSCTWLAPAAFQTWIVGMALQLTSGNPGGASLTPISIRDVGTTQVDIAVDYSTSKLLVRRGGSTTIITSAKTLLQNVYYFIELKVKIDNTVGEVELWIDGVLDGTFSGDTQQSANASADRMVHSGGTGGNGGFSWRIDDVYICDDTGSIANDVLGDVRVLALLPNGNGNSSQLVGSDGNSTDNYLLVDESSPNSDTDYVESSTPGDKDTYTYGNISQAGTIYGVQVCTYAKKTDAGARTIASVARLSATEEDSSDFTLTTGYKYHVDVREEKPGGGAWAVSDVNSAEFGVKVTA